MRSCPPVHVVQEQQQQLGLLHAFQLLLTLRQLDSRLSCDQHSQVQLLSTGAGIFVDTAVIGVAQGSYLKTCLMLLAPFFAGGPALGGVAYACLFGNAAEPACQTADV